MYFAVPTYVQRQYASNEGLYKIHAITKTKGIQQGNHRPLYDTLVQYLPWPAPEKPSRLAQRPPVDQEEAARHTHQELQAGDPHAGRKQSQVFVPNPLDRTARSRSYSPQGRFRELGYDANYLPPQAFSREQQQPWRLRHAKMINAYRTLAAT